MRASRVWLVRTEIAASILGVAGFIGTLIEPQWIERLFDQSPDAGDGSAERWLVSAAFLVAALIAALLARREQRRGRAATPPLPAP